MNPVIPTNSKAGDALSSLEPLSKWGTIQDAADRYKVSTKTIRRMITRGQIEAKRFGPRLIRVNLASVDNAGRSLQYGGDLG